MPYYISKIFISILLGSFCLLSPSACSSKKEPKPRALVEVGTTPEFILLEQAKESYDRGLYDLSLKAWTELRDSHPGSYFAALAELKIADCLFLAKKFDEAAAAYDQFITIYRGNEATDYAHFQIAEAHLAQYKGPLRDQSPLKSAIEAYNRLIQDAPKSEYSALAKKRLEKTKEHLASHVAAVAEFYLKRELYDSSLGRFAQLAAEHGDTSTAKKAGEKMLALYRENEEFGTENLVKAEEIFSSIKPKIIEESAAINLASLGKNSSARQALGESESKLLPASSLRVIQNVDCREDESTLVFVMRSSLALTAPQTSNSERASAFKSRALFAENNLAPNNPDAEHQSCALSGVNAEFSRTQDGIELKVSSDTVKITPTVFTMDRPHRFVAIVHKP